MRKCNCPFALYEGHGNARIIYNVEGEPVALASGAFTLTLDTHHDGLVMMRGDWHGDEDLHLETDWILALRLLQSFFALGRDTELTEWW